MIIITKLWQYSWIFNFILKYCVHISPLPDCLHVGNKCDLEPERQVQFEEACHLAKERGILAALETSAKVRVYPRIQNTEEKF